MILPSAHFFVKQCHSPWRSSLFRTIMHVHRRQLATAGQSKKDSKKKDNDSLVQSTTTDNQIEIATFKEKGEIDSLNFSLLFLIIDFSPTSSERYRLFSHCYCWCSSIRWFVLFNASRTLFQRNTQWNL